MNAKEIAEHYTSYRQYGIDIPISLDGMSRVVTWRDRHVTHWQEGVSIFKQIYVKTTATVGILLTLALSIAEFVARIFLFIPTLPLQPFEMTRAPSVRLQESVVSCLCVTLFSLEALRHNLVEKCVGKKIIHPRLSHHYLDFYGRSI